jgi:hypothetical protein
MSIVLVIIGLLLGGIVVGQDLISAAGQRNISKEIVGYQTAYATFYQKYNASPGDMQDPAAFFPTQSWLGGNNDGKIIWTGEGAEAWRQMVLAGFVSGVTNTTCSANCVAVPGGTVPASQSNPKAGWTLMHSTELSKNLLLFGAQSAAGYMAADPVISPRNVYDLDSKIDDGLADSGNIIARNTAGFADCETSGTYNIQTETPVCNFSVGLGLGK